MTHDIAQQILESISPARTPILLNEIQFTRQLVDSHQYVFRQDPELVQEHLVEPLLDSLGFTSRYRKHLVDTPNQCVLMSRQVEIAYVLVHPLWANLRYAKVARTVRKRTGFNQRIVLTDGLNWRIYNASSEIPPSHFTLDNPAGFFDLFVMGVRNLGG